jgi:hypothetical protein
MFTPSISPPNKPEMLCTIAIMAMLSSMLLLLLAVESALCVPDKTEEEKVFKREIEARSLVGDTSSLVAMLFSMFRKIQQNRE